MLTCLAGCLEDRPASAVSEKMPAEQFVILTPTNESIRDAFGFEFSSWHRQNYGVEVDVSWIVRGTPECVQYVEDFYTLPSEVAPRTAPDVIFGGSVVDHTLLAERGRSIPVELGDVIADLPTEVAGIPTRDKQNRWFATSLTSFGILFNHQAGQAYGLEPPTRWSDLADPRYYSWMAIADPQVSGSNRFGMMLVLQQHGWSEGWGILIRILANSRAVVGTSSRALDQVQDGVSLAAFAADVDGMSRAERFAPLLSYIQPEDGTAVTPDALSLLHCSTNRKIGERFLRYCLSDAGQELWSVHQDRRRIYQPTLYHYPISPTFYEKRWDDLALKRNPLTDDSGLRIDAVESHRQMRAIAPLVTAACGVNHLELHRLWGKIINAGMPADALAALLEPPLSEEQAFAMADEYQKAEPVAAAAILHQWTSRFQEQYKRIGEMLVDLTAAPTGRPAH